jgi:flagellar basal-body rod protein FlgB
MPQEGPMLDRLSATLQFNAEALRLRAERTQVLASNLANADTPNYRARDFNFAQALATATGTRSGGGVNGGSASLAPERTSAGHLPGAGGGPLQPTLGYRVPLQTSLDANTVDADVERAKFAENTLRYEAGLRFINNQIKTLQSAITGNVT